MSRSNWRVSLLGVALGGAGLGGLALAAAGSFGTGAAPTSTAAVAPASSTTVASTNSAAAATTTTAGTTTVAPTTTGVPGFADGDDARLAAEELIGAYIASEFGFEVSDSACSVPESGAVGDEFACYALKPGNLVIALRATVRPQRLVELDLLLDQSAATTTSTVAEATATTGG